MEILTLINEIIKQIRELFDLLTSKPNTTIDEIETKVHQVMIEIGRQHATYPSSSKQSWHRLHS